MADIFEFRGVDNLVYAEVTGDDNEESGGYVTGTVKTLSPVATIAIIHCVSFGRFSFFLNR